MSAYITRLKIKENFKHKVIDSLVNGRRSAMGGYYSNISKCIEDGNWDTKFEASYSDLSTGDINELRDYVVQRFATSDAYESGMMKLNAMKFQKRG